MTLKAFLQSLRHIRRGESIVMDYAVFRSLDPIIHAGNLDLLITLLERVDEAPDPKEPEP